MFSVLFVCTGNICRSPMAEGFVGQMSAGLGAGLDVSSAGIVGWEGSPAVDEAVRAAAECGVDISRHLARRLERRHVQDADVVIGMSGEHRDGVVELVPEAEGRTFTLKELVRLLEGLPATPGPSFAEHVRRADELRRSGFEGNPRDEDVADPLGMSLEQFQAVAWEVQEWCARLVRALVGSPAEARDAG